MSKKKKCACWYGAIPTMEKHDIITTLSIRFIGKNEAAIFYFTYCPKCRRRL